MIGTKKAYLPAILALTVTTHASADISLKDQLALEEYSEIDLQGYTQSLSGDVTVKGVKYIFNGTLMLQPLTTMTLEEDSGLVFTSYGSDGRRAGQLLVMGGASGTIIIQAEPDGSSYVNTKGIMFLGRDAIKTPETNLCNEGFSSECEEYFDYFNYGSLNPTDYQNDSCSILNNVTIEGLGIQEEIDSNANAVTFGGCGRGTYMHNVKIRSPGGNGAKLFGGEVTLSEVTINDAVINGISWDENYLGWLLRPSVRHPTESSYRGNNPYFTTAYGPTICGYNTFSTIFSEQPKNGEDLTLVSGTVYINEPTLFNTIDGDSTNVKPTEDIPFSAECAPTINN